MELRWTVHEWAERGGTWQIYERRPILKPTRLSPRTRRKVDSAFTRNVRNVNYRVVIWNGGVTGMGWGGWGDILRTILVNSRRALKYFILSRV